MLKTVTEPLPYFKRAQTPSMHLAFDRYNYLGSVQGLSLRLLDILRFSSKGNILGTVGKLTA